MQRCLQKYIMGEYSSLGHFLTESFLLLFNNIGKDILIYNCFYFHFCLRNCSVLLILCHFSSSEQITYQYVGSMMHFYFFQFPMGPGSDGPMGGLGGMDSHHMNGSLGKENTFLINQPDQRTGQFGEILSHVQVLLCIQDSYSPVLLRIELVCGTLFDRIRHFHGCKIATSSVRSAPLVTIFKMLSVPQHGSTPGLLVDHQPPTTGVRQQ